MLAKCSRNSYSVKKMFSNSTGRTYYVLICFMETARENAIWYNANYRPSDIPPSAECVQGAAGRAVDRKAK